MTEKGWGSAPQPLYMIPHISDSGKKIPLGHQLQGVIFIQGISVPMVYPH